MGSQREAVAAVVALFLGNVALSLGALFVRMADTGPVSAAFWRPFLVLPLIIGLAWIFERRDGPTNFKYLKWIVLASFAFAIDLGIWHVGIELTRLGNATLFGNAASLVLMFWGLPDRTSSS